MTASDPRPKPVAGQDHPPRFFIAGTDTEVGKTYISCQLLAHLSADGLRILPQKPAASGAPAATGDPAKLQRACGLAVSLEDVCPRNYEAPLAPGVAAHPGRFTHDPPDRQLSPARAPLDHERLQALEQTHAVDATIIEGAGGIWVPMPGPSWLPDWVAAYRAQVIVVGRLGLGTVNHTILTLDALGRLGLPVAGFVLNEMRSDTNAQDPSCPDNVSIIEGATGRPCLAICPWGGNIQVRPAFHDGVYLPMQKREKIASSTSAPTAPIR